MPLGSDAEVLYNEVIVGIYFSRHSNNLLAASRIYFAPISSTPTESNRILCHDTYLPRPVAIQAGVLVVEASGTAPESCRLW